jgi:predicted amidohydrolase
MTSTVAPYLALPLQLECPAVNSTSNISEARQRMLSTIAHSAKLIAGSKAFSSIYHGIDVRLVVLPEYFMTGFPMGESIEEWQLKACIAEGEAEYELLGKVAQDNKVYLAGNAYELDPNFPELYFQTSFIIDDGGDLVLRYRRLISMFAPTPHDVLDAYLDCYGEEALFPVIDTPLGRLACVASEEILFPEITRSMTLRGAELFCHSSSETTGPLLSAKEITRRARACENMVYVVSSNSAVVAGTSLPSCSADGHSQVIGYKGQVLAEAGPGESMSAVAEIDIDALRKTRLRPAMSNLLARQRLELFDPVYSRARVYPANTLLENGKVIAPDRGHYKQTQIDTIAELRRRGVI